MIFCNKCFIDPEIQSIIKGLAVRGDCQVCGSRNAHLYDTDKNIELIEYFEDLISIYTPNHLLPSEYPQSEVNLLKDELLNNWYIFNYNLKNSEVYSIIQSICQEKYKQNPELFDNPVGIAELYDTTYNTEHSLLKTNSWENFLLDLKTVNRFHSNHINLNILEKFCTYIRKKYHKGSIFYRGRVSLENGYPENEMGAPPPNKSTAGRANSQGIRCLYLANDIETTIHEVRAGAFDFISVGKFELQKDIIVVDFKSIDKISPFIENLDPLEYAINREHLNKINKEMGKALRRGDSPLDYVPTQYISDFIKSLCIEEEYGGKYAGIEYNSTMNRKGYNLAIFYPEYFKCISVDVYKIENLKYEIVEL